MHKRKPYTRSICGAEVPSLPMPVLKHQMSHVKRRPYAADRQEPARPINARRKFQITAERRLVFLAEACRKKLVRSHIEGLG
jgi:hypothetical protein